jgi:hypothetical protein
MLREEQSFEIRNVMSYTVKSTDVSEESIASIFNVEK